MGFSAFRLSVLVLPLLGFLHCGQTVAAPALGLGPFAEGGRDLFAGRELPRLKILLSDQAMDSLLRHPRSNVLAVIEEGTRKYSNVLVHLKGTASFRPVDNKPSLTLTFQQSLFHGLGKVHLNNSVEDSTFLNEFLGSQVFQAAGLPAARTTHALLNLNGRCLGLYVLKEGYTATAADSVHAEGELYEPGLGHDIDEPLRLVFGTEPERVRLRALGRATAEPDLPRRWDALKNILDVEQFVSFMALEVLLNHRDGYCMARNNFRVYRDPRSGRFIFLPHGMDKLFGKADATLIPRMSGRLAAAVLEVPQGLELYKSTLQHLATNVFGSQNPSEWLDERTALLAPLLSRPERGEFVPALEGLKERLALRRNNVFAQLKSWSLLAPQFTQNRTPLTNWTSAPLGNKGLLDITPRGELHIEAEPGTAAAWKTRVLLSHGNYRFSAQVRTEGARTSRPAKNPGARLRVSGTFSGRTLGLTGSQPWKKLDIAFTVVDTGQPVELFCELSADTGQAWWHSVMLERVP